MGPEDWIDRKERCELALFITYPSERRIGNCRHAPIRGWKLRRRSLCLSEWKQLFKEFFENAAKRVASPVGPIPMAAST